MRVQIRMTGYDHPDAVLLTAQVQQEYVERYGGPDDTPVDVTQFDAPYGRFLLGYLDDAPAATGGWRAQDASPEGFADGDAELKRMYVVPQARGKGLARRMLAELERDAAAAGRTRMVLETGTMQPEAIALYTSCGYTPVAKFGHYKDSPLSVCLGKSLLSVGPATAAAALPA